jgi:lipopolysaccharide transport system ATP-binding protein
MYVRLAFAVAAHLKSEILIIDEVLAVGDAQFQKRCLGKMGDVAKEGRTVLLVSHNMGAVNSLCSRVIWLEKGKVVSIGQSEELISRYVAADRSLKGEVTWPDAENAPGNKNLRLKAVRVLSEGLPTSEPRIDREIIIEVEYWNLVPGAILYNSVQLRDHLGGVIFASLNWPSAIIGPDLWAGRPRPIGAYCSRMVIPPNWLNSNTYTLDIGMADGSNRWQEDLGGLNILSFTGIDMGEMRKEYMGPWGGTIRPKFSWSTVRIAEADKNGM